MTDSEALRVGIVGAAGRGRDFPAGFEANGAKIVAVCDIQADKLPQCAAALGASEMYANYEEMLDKTKLDAVVVGTPMDLHVPQSILALQRDLHVLCEVPAGVSVEECRQLVLAARKSKGVYMMAENYIYMRPNMTVRELVRQGLFGTTYYAEGEYIHELKHLNEITKWRRRWQTGIDGVTYGTHSLGPILQWMPSDRVVRVCCEGSGRHYKDPRGKSYHQESAVMLCKTAAGALIKIRVDMISDRPHAMTNYHLQGTDGVYDSTRNRIWLRALSEEVQWIDFEALWRIDSLAEKYTPEEWRKPPPQALRAGHGGGDYFEVLDFIRAIRGQSPCTIGIHEAMDMTLPGLISQESIAQEGKWLAMPDSRRWTDEPPYRQLHMVWPASRMDSPPEAKLPSGYELRQFRDADEPDYLELLRKAGLATWDHQQFENTRKTVLPGGFFVVEHEAMGRIVATALAQHMPQPLHPCGGELGWVAADPEHKGKGLGKAVCAAAVSRLIRAGYKRVYLSTDDHRLPALKVYLDLGFEPLLYQDDMQRRWSAVKKTLGI